MSRLSRPSPGSGVTGAGFALRPITPYGSRQLAGVGTKLYGIAVAGPEPRARLVDAACERAALVLAGARRAEAAFVVAHNAAPACFVLVCWWADRVQLCHRYFRAPLDRPDTLEELGRPALACVWELPVISYERDAWVRHVLAEPGGRPGVAAYLRDQMRVSAATPPAQATTAPCGTPER